MPELRRLDVVDSTMEVAHAMARDGAGHGAAVVALRQRGARGTRGRQWSAGTGGLWLSVVLRPTSGEGVDLLPLRLGLGIAEALSRWGGDGPEVQVKWPNDLQVAGRKVGGILCEARWRGDTCQWIVAGVGINVINEMPADLAALATRFADYGVGGDALEAMGERVIAVAAGLDTAAGELSADELRRWKQRDALRGSRITSPYEGIAGGVTATGALRVVGDDGECRLARSGVAPGGPPA